MPPLRKWTMASAGTAPIPLTLKTRLGPGPIDTPALLAAMLRANTQVSDLLFSPGRLPQVEVLGQLVPVEAPGLHPLTADDTRRIASDLIGNNKQAITMLREQGSCDVSYGLSGLARFRVSVFIQRGSCAIIMRVIPTSIPSFHSLGLPPELGEIAHLRSGIVLVTGPRGSGKSSTLAAILDKINELQTCHIITIEDPIEFLHNHKKATIHQRELHSDVPSVALALRAALRQGPRVILIGELRDRDTMEMALEAAETEHLVFSSMNAMDAAKTVDRFVGSFQLGEQAVIRSRFARAFRYIISQRLIPRKNGNGRIAAFTVLKTNPAIHDIIENEESPGQKLLDCIKDPAFPGMRRFDAEIVKLVRAGEIDIDAALAYASNPRALSEVLAHAAAGSQ